MEQAPASRASRSRATGPLHAVRISAFLHAHGTRRPTQIIDYSQHGLELERAAGIAPQERVTVELLSGFRLPMMVLWVKGDSAGLRFLGPIALGHAVMSSLNEAARKYKRRRAPSASA